MAFNFEEFGQEVQKEQGQENLSFMERLRLSFGDEESIKELKTREERAGLRGKFDVGDIADVAGGALPFLGASVGAIATSPTALLSGPVGPAVGAGIGTAAGESAKQTIGHLLGVRKGAGSLQEAKTPVISGVSTAVGAKVLGIAGKYIAERLPKLLGLF